MSRLIYQGNLNKNFGEFFPTPYIDKVVLNSIDSDDAGAGLEMDIQYSLLFTVPEHDPVMPNNDTDFVKEIVNRLQFYFIVTKSSPGMEDRYEKLSTSPRAGMSEPKEQHLAKLQEYKDATGVDFSAAGDTVDELSLLLYDSSILVEFLKNPSSTLGDTIGNTYDSMDANKGTSYDLLHIDRQSILDSLAAENYATFYSKGGRRILKVQNLMAHQTVVRVPSATQVPLTPGQQMLYDRHPEDYAHFIQYDYELKKVSNPNINLLAFSSLLTPEQIAESSLKTNSALSLMFGDVAYEKVLEKGGVSSQSEYSYFDNNNEIYVQTPLQALNGSYHKADTTTHSDIVSKFKQLIDKYAALRPPGREDDDGMNPELSASIDTFSYALQEYKERADLLPQLKSARNTIMNRSSGTVTGAFYNDVGSLLKRADDVVNRGTALTKKLTINAKIIDRRENQLGSYILPEQSPLSGELLLKNFNLGRTIQWTNEPSYRTTLADHIGEEGFAGFGTIGLGKMDDLSTIHSQGGSAGNVEYSFELNDQGQFIIYVDSILGRQTIELDNADWNGLLSTNYFAKEEYSISFGYFLYDWESHVTHNSFLASFVDVERFIKHFGYELISAFFVPTSATLKKYMPLTIGDDENIKKAFAGHENLSSPILIYTKNMQSREHMGTTAISYDPDGQLGTVERQSGPEGEETTMTAYPEKITTKTGQLLQHYLTERNMDYLGTQETLDNSNRMIAFEFQNLDQHATLDEHDKAVVDTYEFEVSVTDNTKMSLVNLIRHYFYLSVALRDYLVDAELECSYNNIDGIFNDFFAENMQAKFSANPAGAPWIFCPTVYVKHVDFLTNKYRGDETEMLLAAREIIQKISPQTGTLAQLKAFYENFVDLYTNYYSQSSVIGNRLATFGFSSTTGPYSFATPMPIVQNINHKVTELNYANQSESSRDEFISTINAERDRYQTASDAYSEAIRAAKAENVKNIKDLFIARSALLTEKIQYEYDRVQYAAGCQYTWWWDAWSGKVDFTKHTKPNKKRNYDVTSNEFSDIDPMGIADGQYGYVWVDPYKEDDVVGWYDVEKFGEPTYHSNLRRDKEQGGTGGDGDGGGAYYGCRHVKRAYRFRESDFRWDGDKSMKNTAWDGIDNDGDGLVDEDGESSQPDTYHPAGGIDTSAGSFNKWYTTESTTKGRREYGGYAGSPSNGGKLYETPSGNDLWHSLIQYKEPDEGWEQRLPGFDAIHGYKNYNEWLAAAQDKGGGAASRKEYQGGEQEETSAYDQFADGYNTSQEKAADSAAAMSDIDGGSSTDAGKIGSDDT